MNEIRKSREEIVSASALPDEAALEKISAFARRPLSAEEVYAFPVVLCDNDIDRDTERFTEACLKEMASLAVGSTGLKDHEAKTDNQTARLYECEAVTSPTEKNALGRPLMRLVGKAYMLRTEGNRERIAAIEGGIAKEVSISCSVGEQRCSVCGRDIRICPHRKGQTYGGTFCFAELENPSDVYEWSFVAIPAQKGAGVIKERKAVTKMKENEKLVKELALGKLETCEETVTLSPEEAVGLSERMKQLSVWAELGEKYDSELRGEVKKLSRLCELSLPEETAESIAKKLTAGELTEVKKWLSDLCAAKFPLKAQTAPEQEPGFKSDALNVYRI